MLSKPLAKIQEPLKRFQEIINGQEMPLKALKHF